MSTNIDAGKYKPSLLQGTNLKISCHVVLKVIDQVFIYVWLCMKKNSMILMDIGISRL